MNKESKITATIIDLTPDFANRLLTLNRVNRPLREAYAKKLASSMARGEWAFNGDTICVSDTGNLLQGQHRCTAVVISGITITVILVEGVPDSVFSTYDRGIGRTTGDVFHGEGIANYNAVAAITRLILLHRALGNPYKGTTQLSPTTQQQEKLLKDEKDAITRAANMAVSSRWAKKYISPSLAGFCYYMFAEKDKHSADVFFDALESGAGLDDTSPALLLRNRLMNDYGEQRKLDKTIKAALVFKAFRNFRIGLKMRSLRIRTEGESPETNLFSL